MNYNDRIKKILIKAGIAEEKAISGYERRLERIYINGMKNVRLLMAEIFSKYGASYEGNVVVNYDDIFKYGRLTKLQKEIFEEFGRVRKSASLEIDRAMIESYRENYFIHSFAIDSTLTISPTWKFLNVNAIRAALINPMTQIQWGERHTENVKALTRRVQDSVVRTFQQGQPYKRFAAELGEHVGKTVNEAKRILWTETHRAQNIGLLESYRDAKAYGERYGIKLVRRWDATLDAKTRPNHQAADGQIEDENGMFDLDGIKAAAPGLSGVASEDINCRCTTVTFIPDLPPRYRYDPKVKKSERYQTYQEWAKKHNIRPRRKVRI